MNPYNHNAGQNLEGIGETTLLKSILEWLGESVLAAPYGPGEDCAVMPVVDNPRVITTDPVWFQRHFDQSLSPEAVGRKLVVRNLSDLAAAGAEPEGGLFSLFAPSYLNLEWLERCCRTIGATAHQYGLGIAGGDIAQIPSDLGLNLTLWGKTHAPVPGRAKVEIGDTLWVTGHLGGSILGPHWQFEPRLAEGAWLAASGWVSGMMDISDGLAADLPRLLAPQQQASLNLEQLPLREEAYQLAETTDKPAWLHAWSDGEDYELLFALKKDTPIETFREQWQTRFLTPLHCIGKVDTQKTPHSPFFFHGNQVPDGLQGYEHFKKDQK